ncbi:MAG: bifunctional metallophosphatase/5'-nucleotidase [Deltaproteobacteria bacterium]|nr:bifunctional metallophosphatase/5'-nucleotidase [Deltaproteobacteria bacterium]
MYKKTIVILFLLFLAAAAPPALAARAGSAVVKIIATTDVHGAIFPYDFIRDKPADGSLAQLSSFLAAERSNTGQQVLLLDNGDFLQGQPVVYYYNFENTRTGHIVSEVMNDLGYDAATVGNHDIEAGHPVYDRIRNEFKFPWLAANAVKPDGSPYFSPYTIIKKGSVKIAVIGMVTPGIPNWLPQQFWTGMRFEDMIESARKWIKIVKEKETPDLVIGLFHSGVDYTYGGQTADTPCNENASQLVAERVAGFDVVFAGHDHKATNKTVKGPDGKTVRIFGAQNAMKSVAVVKAAFTRNTKTGAWEKTVSGMIKPVAGMAADQAFLSRFDSQYREVKAYVSRPIGKLATSISARDALFGDSAFMGLIHRIQLEITGSPEFGLNRANISFAAPLLRNASLPSSPDGVLYVRDLFSLYKYENFLYTMQMTGRQVKDYLEYSYAGWMNTMQSDADHMIRFKKNAAGNVITDEKTGMPVPAANCYTYDSAAGIRYTVDLTKPAGSRLTILSMADGTPFSLTGTYSVAVNSYRAQGAGGHLVRGAGMTDRDVKAMKFVTSSTVKDIRYYLMKWIEAQKGPVTPEPSGNWQVVPEAWAAKAGQRDRPLLYTTPH